MSKRPSLKRTLGMTALSIGLTIASGASFAKEVTIGYQGMFNPWKYAIDQELVEKETGVEIKWRKFDSGAKAISAIASGSVDLTVAGSSPIATAVSRGVDVELVWIMENIAEAEALVVRDGSGIKSPSDLKGKRIAVPFVSTTHYHMLFALKEFGLTEKDVKLVNMQPNAINAAWARGDIDGAFIWDPVLGSIKKDGSVLISSKELSSWGKPTFDGLIASKEFTSESPEFVAKLIKIIAETDEMYRQAGVTFSVDHPIAKSVNKVVGGEPEQVVEAMALYDFPTIPTQVSCQWLGCKMEGGAAKALLYTSEFLLEEKKINALQEDYSAFVNPAYANMALTLTN
ncbi:taurine ABC transporter substrate-binding protein [uncultured Endozoicomonas sp.]|uniref:taurine ABC transporter substrate-binding protein n=1 Tax=uncultured Endozoicomonas sp. TaxID=432652 RepID=UPI00260EE689|nr:taurine ABC transporter substrate-binding protein [uncultured Endozoicomonas sp.]